MQYKSCSFLEYFHLMFSGSEQRLAFCCPQSSDMPLGVPEIDPEDTPARSFEKLIEMRANIISESVKLALYPHTREQHTVQCADCISYNKNNWSVGGDGFIHMVTLGFYPSPCQCKCIYCGIHKSKEYPLIDEKAAGNYSRSFDLIGYALENKMIVPGALWDVNCGEITVHPFKDKIYALIKDRKARFFTNCFIFDEAIGENLKANQGSSIYLSIDAGTPETWHKVKGVNNFKSVADNLVKYYSCASRQEQIAFKYIILPDINDNRKDFIGVIKIMKALDMQIITISRELINLPERQIAPNKLRSYRNKEIEAAGNLVAILHDSGIRGYSFWNYSQEEIQKIGDITNTLLSNACQA